MKCLLSVLDAQRTLFQADDPLSHNSGALAAAGRPLSTRKRRSVADGGRWQSKTAPKGRLVPGAGSDDQARGSPCSLTVIVGPGGGALI